jgi:hypothetical protein
MLLFYIHSTKKLSSTILYNQQQTFTHFQFKQHAQNVKTKQIKFYFMFIYVTIFYTYTYINLHESIQHIVK